MECLAQNSAPTVRSVFSSATALAPFSQNSAALRFLSDSGQAQPGQSKPPRWLRRSRDCAVRVTPAWATARSSATITAFTPAASVFGLPTARESSLMSATGAGCMPNFIVPTSLPAHAVLAQKAVLFKTPGKARQRSWRALRGSCLMWETCPTAKPALLAHLGQRLPFGTDGGVVAVAGADDGLGRERQQPFADGGQDGGVVAVGASGGAGAAVEQGVPGEHGALGCEVEAGGAR